MLNEIAKIIAPHRCNGCKKVGNLLCLECAAKIPLSQPVCYRCNKLSDNFAVCRSCRSTSALNRVYFVGLYETHLKQLIWDTKFTQARQGCVDMANIITQNINFMPTPDAIITYVSTASVHVRRRGFDHARLIAENLSLNLGIVCSPLLVRVKQSRQVGATRQTRKKQIIGNFSVRGTKDSQKGPIILVDDVISTGATLEEAARTLRRAGYGPIYGVVVARNK